MKSTPMITPTVKNTTDISHNKADAPTDLHSHFEMAPSQSTTLNQDDSKPKLSHQAQVPSQKESNQNTNSSSIESTDLQTVSAFRPKLGLRFGKKATKTWFD